MIACKRRGMESIALLLHEEDVDLDARNRRGETAHTLAWRRRGEGGKQRRRTKGGAGAASPLSTRLMDWTAGPT